MKWKNKPMPKEGAIKYKYKFLWLPLRIGDEVRWLELAHIKYVFHIRETYTIMEGIGVIPETEAGWKAEKFIMNDPVYECDIYKGKGCAHVDGMFCNPLMCEQYDK